MDRLQAGKHGFSMEAAIRTIVMLAAAVVIITVCSKSSPLYPLNDWDDPNCFFTVGKSLASGRVLYRDIYEQKGPLLYFMHTAAVFISDRSFFGVYLIEAAAAFLFLIFSRRTFSLFCGDKAWYALLPMAALVYTSLAFCGGDSAEELCLPLLSYSLYVLLSCTKHHRSIQAGEGFFFGLGAGIVLWVKYTILGFYIGMFLVLAAIYFRRRELRRMLILFITALTGAAAASLPVIWYFLRTDAFADLWQVYFYDNIFLYKTDAVGIPVLSQLWNLLIGMGSFAAYNTVGFLCLTAAVCFMLRQKKRTMKFAFLLTASSTFFFVFAGGRAFAYYSLIMSVFAPVGVAAVYTVGSEKCSKLRIKKAVPGLSSVISLALLCALCRNTYLIFTPRESLPQFRFERIISQVENPTLLNYGFLDGGFYTVSGIVPQCRFFCRLNIPLSEMYAEQDAYVSQGRVDFIVTKDEKPEWERYECIDECHYTYWSNPCTYYLYRLRQSDVPGG